MRFLFAACLTFPLVSCGSSGNPPVTTLAGQALGTNYVIRIGNLPDEVKPIDLRAKIEERIASFDESLSTWRDDSQISGFNRHTETDWYSVSPEFAAVVQQAKDIHSQSGGAFDPTVKPLVDIWDFGAQRRVDQPADAEVLAAMSRLGFTEIDVRSDPPAIRKSRTIVSLDLSAIAKGYVVDIIGDLLTERGLTSWLVEVGGEIRTSGRKPDGKAWSISITMPRPENLAESERVLTLTDAAIATSGDYRNYRIGPDGNRYSHAIDPRTGRPVQHRLASVSVIADDCMNADAWATALLVLGDEEGFQLAEEIGLAVLFLYRDDDDEKRILSKTTSEFRSRFPEARSN